MPGRGGSQEQASFPSRAGRGARRTPCATRPGGLPPKNSLNKKQRPAPDPQSRSAPAARGCQRSPRWLHHSRQSRERQGRAGWASWGKLTAGWAGWAGSGGAGNAGRLPAARSAQLRRRRRRCCCCCAAAAQGPGQRQARAQHSHCHARRDARSAAGCTAPHRPPAPGPPRASGMFEMMRASVKAVATSPSASTRSAAQQAQRGAAQRSTISGAGRMLAAGATAASPPRRRRRAADAGESTAAQTRHGRCTAHSLALFLRLSHPFRWGSRAGRG